MFVSFEGLDGSGQVDAGGAPAGAARGRRREPSSPPREPGRHRARRADPRPRPARRPRRAVGRGAALRRRPRAARRAGHPAGARARRVGRLRPLRRLLGRVPGSRARARARAGARPQPRRGRRGHARPDLPPAARSRPGLGRASAASTTGSSARTRSSTAASTPGYRELAERFPERIVVLDGDASSRSRSQRRCMEHFASVPEQLEAKRLLEAALADEPAHAYLLHGPPGVGKRTAATRVRRRAARGRAPGRGSHASRPLRPRAARGDDPHRRRARAAARPAHAPLRGGATRLPRSSTRSG